MLPGETLRATAGRPLAASWGLILGELGCDDANKAVHAVHVLHKFELEGWSNRRVRSTRARRPGLILPSADGRADRFLVEAVCNDRV